MKPENSNTALNDGASPLPRWPAFWRRVGLLVGALAGVAWISAATIDQDREPNFDFSQLGRDNVLLNGSLSVAQENRLRMNYVRRAAPFDVVLIGSHNLRGFGGQFSAPLGRFFSLFNINQNVYQLPDILRDLEKHGKMPKRALVVSILAHARPQWVAQPGPSENRPQNTADALPTPRQPAFNWRPEIITAIVIDKLKRLFDSESFLLGLLGPEHTLVRLNFPKCHAANAKGFPSIRSAPGGVAGKLDAVIDSYRAKLSEILPVPVGLGTGLVDHELFCRTRNGFHKAAEGFRFDGSVYGPTLALKALNNPYSESVIPAASVRRQGTELGRLLSLINDIAKRNGVPAIFVVPPRHETDSATRRSADAIMDTAFSRSSKLAIVDHRNLRDQLKLFSDHTHVSDLYDQRLAPCIEAVIATQQRAAHLTRNAAQCK